MVIQRDSGVCLHTDRTFWSGKAGAIRETGEHLGGQAVKIWLCVHEVVSSNVSRDVWFTGAPFPEISGHNH